MLGMGVEINKTIESGEKPQRTQVLELEDGWDLLSTAVRVEGAGAQEWTPWRNPQT